ncbi:alpha/beta fold hydrolase [Candidatus Entotheonella palauensis]|uniref:alpha/beta fold hydrolase n=1 Tax=Candidatus Entotheonella palauensis TaxID=93172 RepID=UPI000B7F6DE5|nr:alpha/beta fold hydrolase [Candidatus Entotheonella palauensis]
MTDSSTIKFVRTPALNIGYEEHGDTSGFPIILLHGFPYDIRSFDGVAPPLVEAGYRVFVPYLRGYGATRFLDPKAPRMAEQAAIGQDVGDFAEALRIDQCARAGIVIHSYRHRHAPGKERFLDVERELAKRPVGPENL